MVTCPLNSDMTCRAASFINSRAAISFGFSNPCAAENRWKPFPSMRTIRYVLGIATSVISYRRTYSKREPAIAHKKPPQRTTTMDVLSNIDPTSSGSAAADPFRPSFFELMAQEQLASLLKPAVRYVITVLAQRYPRYLLRIVNRFDELYALIMLAVNRHYLRTWSTFQLTRCVLHRKLLRSCSAPSPGCFYR